MDYRYDSTMSKHTNKYMNRDISWLSFNNRVLEEAGDKDLPLYERLKFLAIYSSNLDEFYKVRVATYRRMLKQSREKHQKVASDLSRVLSKILDIVDHQQHEFGRIFWKEMVPELKQNNISLVQNRRLSRSCQEYINRLFQEELVPCLQPILLLKGKITPFLQDGAIYLAVKMFKKPVKPDGVKHQKARYAIVNIPKDQMPRFIELPVQKERHTIIFLDDIVRMNLDKLFPGYTIDSSYSIKLSRDADLDIGDEFSGDLPEKISRSLVKRKTGMPSRFLYDSAIPDSFLKLLRSIFKLAREDLVPGGKYHHFSDLFTFPNPVSPKLEIKTLPPLVKKELVEHDSIFEALEEKDWILHFPYHSFDPVIRFLNEAALDPKVKEIKATQYRVASDSAVVNALINARRNGKKVSVFVEIKARFDEYANLQFARQMKKSGIQIIYSIPGLKVHAKAALVLRKPQKGRKEAYAFLSTGNFNEKTAKIYADHGFLTSDQNITSDLKELFLFLENQSRKVHLKHLLMAHFNLKKELIKKIDREIRNAKEGKPAWIILKMNGIDHKKMINKIYEASRNGVKINLIVRGICCVVPGEPYSENITVTRIVDRYLEHARVFVFNNGGDHEMYLASADWMTRNLDRRIELCFPIDDQRIKKEVMNILHIQLQDNTSARNLDSMHHNLPVKSERKEKIRAQLEIYNLLKEKQSISSGQIAF
jgi:polyphosphate kinase